MKIKLKIGDFVKINEKLSCFGGIRPMWFSPEIFQIINIDYNSEYPLAYLDKNLSRNNNNNTIATYYLLPAIKKNRKEKLNKIYENK
jgi:hypothetical protein